MSHAVIRAEHLGKRYTIGASRAIAHRARRDGRRRVASRQVPAVRRDEAAPAEDTLWALDDVSFDVAPGEVVGIIGRNGAGKSTLFKVLSRITEPTTGFVRCCTDAIGSLLEVGHRLSPGAHAAARTST